MEMTGDITSDAFPAFCREHGLKCTAQRLAVFNAVRLSRWHPSVDETLAEVRKTVPTVTRDSVYRILNEFADLGLITRLDALSSARYGSRSARALHLRSVRVDHRLSAPVGATDPRRNAT